MIPVEIFIDNFIFPIIREINILGKAKWGPEKED
jgi:hypothetical protein